MSKSKIPIGKLDVLHWLLNRCMAHFDDDDVKSPNLNYAYDIVVGEIDRVRCSKSRVFPRIAELQKAANHLHDMAFAHQSLSVSIIAAYLDFLIERARLNE